LILLLTSSVLFGCLDSGNGGDQSGNSSPTISGNPPSAVLFNETYSFQPTASDRDGDPLTFQISNKPGWADFNTSTGRLSGSPAVGDVGTYSDIAISVTDGVASRSLPAFGITVNQAALGTVTLSWQAPTQNADGSWLTDLAGYIVYYGKRSGTYDSEIRIDNPSVTTYVIDQLSPATYYFAAASFNSAGVESELSGEAIQTVN